MEKKIEEKDEIIFYVTTQDIQDVAEDKLGRKLSKAEIKIVKNEVWDKFDSYEPISMCLDKLNIE